MLVSSRRPRAERNSASFAPAASVGPAVSEVAREMERGLLAERHDALLAALSADVHDLAVEVDVAEVERDGLLRCASPPSREARAARGCGARAGSRPRRARAARRSRPTSARPGGGAIGWARAMRRGPPQGRTCSGGTSEPLPAGARSTSARAGRGRCRAPRPSPRGRAASTSSSVSPRASSHAANERRSERVRALRRLGEASVLEEAVDRGIRCPRTSTFAARRGSPPGRHAVGRAGTTLRLLRLRRPAPAAV